ncbi:MAG: copper chaperone PCu(A)C [Gemmatimonadaceae bacterium]|nr:copper chaperone PCu(A)C [Gemmatimonadaceae bacterium]
MTNTNRSIHLRFTVAIVAAALCLPAVFGGALHAQTAPVTVRDAWVREPAASRKTTAAFLVIENAGTTKRAIVSASSDAAETVELHEMVRDGAMMKMSPVKTIDVPANGKTELKPGGLHIMMFGLKKQPVAGDTLRITLTLDDGTKTIVAAPVRKMEGMK